MNDTEELFKLIDQMDAWLRQAEKNFVGIPCEHGPLRYVRQHGVWRVCYQRADGDMRPATDCTIAQRIDAVSHLPGLARAHATALAELKLKAAEALHEADRQLGHLMVPPQKKEA